MTIERDICQAIIDKNHIVLSWIIATLPFVDEQFCETHGQRVVTNDATGYLCNGFIDVTMALRETFEKLQDSRLADSIQDFGDTLVEIRPFKESKTDSSNPIVKKHVIADSQADLDKEREQSSQPIEIKVETPRGKSVFVENTSEHSLQNPAKIDIDEEASGCRFNASRWF